MVFGDFRFKERNETMVLVIGLTGGIASGKSTVANYLKEKGLTVIDADIEARLAVEIGEPAYYKIIETFGEEILQVDKKIDRVKLGHIIFNDEEKRKQLNGIVHPEVRKRMNDKKEEGIKRGEKIIVLDIPLLFESKLTYMVDKTLLVYVDEEIQLKRLMERNQLSKEDALARINAQMPLKDKIKLADEVVNNNGTLEETFAQVEQILSKWESLE